MRYRASILLGLAFVLVVMATAHAAPPLIYEGTLTNGDQPPNPWPGLRFSVVDADGVAWWSTMVEPGGPLIEVGPDGRFVAYLEDSPQNPWALAGFDQGRWLRVDVCPGAWPETPSDDCGWVQLEQTQRLGTVPTAITAAVSSKLITENLVLEVSPPVQGAPAGSFRSVQAALGSLEDRLIAPSATVTIAVADGTYPPLGSDPYDEPILIARPDGARIQIIGDEQAPGDVVLRFHSGNGVEVYGSGHLGGLSGITLEGGPHQGVGVLARDGGNAQIGPRVVVRGFLSVSLLADAGRLVATDVNASDSADDGIGAIFGGRLECRGCVSERHGDTALFATYGGFLNCYDCTSANSRRAVVVHDRGLAVLRGGSIGDSSPQPRFDARRLSEIYTDSVPEDGPNRTDETSVISHN